MQPLIYDVAISVDGYICGPGGDISKFAQSGPVVEDYITRLSTYSTAIMGRNTYEFGYDFGLQPGQNPYPHMQTIIVSKTLNLPEASQVTVRNCVDSSFVDSLKKSSNGPLYLCGGGSFAGFMLEKGMIDVLRLKRAPVVLGGGVSLFENTSAAPNLIHENTREYENGYLLQEFRLEY